MEYCVGLNKAIKHWRNSPWPRFEPASPKWHTGTLSTTPQAHAQVEPFVTLAGRWDSPESGFVALAPLSRSTNEEEFLPGRWSLLQTCVRNSSSFLRQEWWRRSWRRSANFAYCAAFKITGLDKVVANVFYNKRYNYMPWLDAVSRPLAPVSSVAGGEDTPRRQGSCCNWCFTWSQSYERELQRQRCRNLQRHKQPSKFWQQNLLFWKML
jgi:hypothetical protein